MSPSIRLGSRPKDEVANWVWVPLAVRSTSRRLMCLLISAVRSGDWGGVQLRAKRGGRGDAVEKQKRMRNRRDCGERVEAME